MVLWNNIKGHKEVVCDLQFRNEQIEAHRGYNELKVILFTLEKLTLESWVLISCWELSVSFRILCYFMTSLKLFSLSEPQLCTWNLKTEVGRIQMERRKWHYNIFNKKLQKLHLGKGAVVGIVGNYFYTKIISCITHLEKSFHTV